MFQSKLVELGLGRKELPDRAIKKKREEDRLKPTIMQYTE